jgi:hypothetical protein
MPPDRNPRPLAQRLLWFAALWLSSVGAMALIALALQLWITPR